MTGSLIACN
ncbi:hypothetical protein E2C01_100442 [Portunus trituberculatus]|uniref:Uncharacterized protein n=1 Tax=Portunus trituberculatus TaxID=210409 RepID=A0A5B7KDJ6_PORTR|nr:hypothetical protein [Portunus trituberculatus]